MYNQTNSSSWKPLHFQDLAITELTPSTNQDKIEELEESEHQPEAEMQEKADDVIDINSPEIVLELENIKQQARKEAYQEGFNVGKQTGYEQGLEIGQQEGREKIEQQLTEEKLKTLDIIRKLADSFQQSINQIDEKIVPKLFDLALIAAQKTIGSLSEVEQRQLMYTIKSLIEQNTVVNPPIVVKVNPKDFVWLEPLIDDKLQQNEWQFIADANIELGGCRIFTQTNEIDASVTTHWQIISDSVHGDEH